MARKREKKMKKDLEELMKPIIVTTGWISNGPGSAGLADISDVYQIEKTEVPEDGLEFLEENGWWREEDGVIQRHYWVRPYPAGAFSVSD